MKKCAARVNEGWWSHSSTCFTPEFLGSRGFDRAELGDSSPRAVRPPRFPSAQLWDPAAARKLLIHFLLVIALANLGEEN